MSLVAYCASDESDTEEVEEQPKPKVQATGVDTISDDEDERPHRPAQQAFAAQTEPEETTATLLKSLPAPKAEEQLPEGEEELEDLVKPKPEELQNAPKPPPKRSGQPVRISIPVLQPDSDDEDDTRPQSKPKTVGMSGLIGLLPPPQYGSRKEANRPLVPHTLTKKRPTPTAAKPSPRPPAPTLPPTHPQKRAAPLLGMEYSDSDEDDDTPAQNFFSLDTAPPEKRARVEPVVDLAPAGSSLPPRGVETDLRPGVSAEEEVEEMEHTGRPGLQNAPLQFGRTTLSAGPSSLSAYSSLTGRSAYMSAQSTLPAYHMSGPKFQPEVEASGSGQAYTESYADYSDEGSAGADVNNLMQDEQFRRLQGKTSRGKEEINIIDANMDDFVTTATTEMVKNISEETAYRSHRKSDNLPTALQRRKKQITYLAFQAKERELELKNSWAQNRMTKRQTQSKYGF